MSSEFTAFERPIKLRLQPSKWIIIAIVLIHLGALSSLYFADIHSHILLALCLLVLLSLFNCYYRFIYLQGISPATGRYADLLLNDKDEWFISNKDRGMSLVTLSSESYVHSALVVLNFKQGRAKRSVILTADTVPADTFRRLRVRLRFTLAEQHSGRVR